MIFTVYQDSTKFKAGVTPPSGSVFYNGAALQFLQNGVPVPQVPCNMNLNQVLSFFDQAVNNLLEQNNLTGLNPQGLSFNPATVTINALHQVEINAIQGNAAAILTLQDDFNNLSGNTLPITINMGCLASIAAPCESSPGVYPLISVLNSFLSEICALKAAVGI
jgi:hypothetical protein